MSESWQSNKVFVLSAGATNDINGWRWITTIRLVKSGDCCVSNVIEDLVGFSTPQYGSGTPLVI